MNILGIRLTNPSQQSLLAALIAGGLMMLIILSLTGYGILSVTLGAMLSASSMGGALANAYGASIKTNGWRGAIVSTLISTILMLVVYLVIISTKIFN